MHANGLEAARAKFMFMATTAVSGAIFSSTVEANTLRSSVAKRLHRQT